MDLSNCFEKYLLALAFKVSRSLHFTRHTTFGIALLKVCGQYFVDWRLECEKRLS